MAANVQVMGGVNRGMGGNKESLSAFRKNTADVSDALLNIAGIGTLNGQRADKDDPRPVYAHEEFPMMVYKPNQEAIVTDRKDLEEHMGRGWRKEPYIKAQVETLPPAEEKKLLMDQISKLEAERTAQTDLITKQGAMLEAMERRLNAMEDMGAKRK